MDGHPGPSLRDLKNLLLLQLLTNVNDPRSSLSFTDIFSNKKYNTQTTRVCDTCMIAPISDGQLIELCLPTEYYSRDNSIDKNLCEIFC